MSTYTPWLPGWTFILPQVTTKPCLQPGWSFLLPLLCFWEECIFVWRKKGMPVVKILSVVLPARKWSRGRERLYKYFCNNSKAVSVLVDLFFLVCMRLLSSVQVSDSCGASFFLSFPTYFLPLQLLLALVALLLSLAVPLNAIRLFVQMLFIMNTVCRVRPFASSFCF